MIYYTDKWKIPFEIDDDDYDLISRYRWYVCDKYIATWSEIYINGLPFKGPLFLHNFLMGRPPKGFEVDHIDRNKMNYRRLNLRIVTRGKNMYNRNIMRTESGYFGVHRNGRGWVSFLSPFENPTNKAIRLGTFKTPLEGHNARLIAIQKFPDWSLHE